MTPSLDYDNSKKDKPLDAAVFGSLTREQVFVAIKNMMLARLTDERVIYLQKTGHAKFGIFGAGKEGVQVALAMCTNDSDFFAGYYRDIGYCVARGMSTKALLMQAVSVKDDPLSGGRSMPNHFADISKGIHAVTSPTGSQCLTAYGVADSWKLHKYGCKAGQFRFPPTAIAMTTIGDSSLREGEAREFLDNIATDQVPVLHLVENDRMGISVSIDDSIYNGDPMYLHRNQPGVRYVEVDGCDFIACHKLFSELVPWIRTERKPATVNASVTALFNHSSTDDRTKYLKVDDIDKRDPITILSETCIQHGVFTPEQITALHNGIFKRLADEAQEVIRMGNYSSAQEVMAPIYQYSDDKAANEFSRVFVGSKPLKKFREAAGRLALSEFPLRMGDAINLTLLEAMIADPRIAAFGEDCADVPRRYILDTKTGTVRNLIDLLEKGQLKKAKYDNLASMIKDNFSDGLRQKGGVFNITKNLQRVTGDRCHNTGICEATIIGKSIGYMANGMIPVPEIQFMDYLRPAMQQLEDEMATLSFRSNGAQHGTCVIRVASSGYLGGAGAIWHSTHEMGPKINRPGFRVVMPCNARDAVGLMRTALYCGDPVIFAEPKSLYNRTHLFDNDQFFMTGPLPDDFRIPFGKGQLYRDQDQDLTIVTYGNTLPMSLLAAKKLEDKGIRCQVIDLRTLKPLGEIDWDLIRNCLNHTGKLLLVDEDREDGSFMQILAGAICSDRTMFERLDAPPSIVAAENSFIPYGPVHEALIAVQEDDIFEAAVKLASY
ncbi:MAG: thiamine pyrophosphate-dependent enzyme [Planctomycetota bacterium]